MKFLLSLLFTILYFSFINGDSISDGMCTKTRVQISSLSPEGQCGYRGLSAVSGFYATVNQNLFQDGLACGSCWEITGPAGSVIVTVTNMCSNQSALCVGDENIFFLNADAFGIISSDPDPNAQLLYDISAHSVSCDVSGPVKMKITGSNVYNVNAFLFNSNSAIDDVSILGSGWYQPKSMTRNILTASFTLQSTQEILPPVVFIASDVFGSSSISLTITGSLIGLDYITFNDNFDVPTLIASQGNISCPIYSPQGDIYHDKLMGSGWISQNSINVQLTFDDEDDSPYQGPSSLSLILGSAGYFYASRNGGFVLGDFTHITFAAKVNGASALPLQLFTQVEGLATPFIDFVAPVQWHDYQIPLSDFSADLTSTDLVWGFGWLNNYTDTSSFYLDNVALININNPSSWPDYNSVNTIPVEPISTTTTDEGFETTSTTGHSSTTTSDSISLIANIIISIVLMCIISLFM